MFDRLRNAPKDRGALPLNRKKLEAWQNSREQSSSANRGVKGGDGQYQYSIRGGPAPPRPSRDPNYPPERHQTRQSSQPLPAARSSNQYRSSGVRPASSVYSQPSPDAATFAAQQLRLQVPHSDPNEISPPSSPDVLSPRDEPNPGDVSPIDELPDMSQLSVDPRGIPKSGARSNIPMMRRERRKNSDAAANALRESASRERLKQPRPHGHDVRWDPNTGEPTTGPKGRPSQVNPQEYAQGLGARTGSVSPPQIKPAKQGQITFGERLRRVRQPSGSQPEPSSRPEWRGASGRMTLVAPMADNQDVAPLKVPPKSSKRVGRESGGLSPVHSVDSEPVSSPVVRGLGISNQPTQPQSPASPSIAITKEHANTDTYPSSPPLSDDNTANPQPDSLQIPTPDKAIRRKPTHQAQSSWSSSVYSDPRTSLVAPQQPPPPADTSLDGWTQPPSRFSVTTYATSQQSATPRDSIDVDGNAPPVPTPPTQFASQQQQQQQEPEQPQPSILDRKRPVVPGYDSPSSRKSNSPAEPVKISLDSYYMTSAVARPRKTSPEAAVPRGNANDSRLSLASLPDKDKSLPLAPPETQSQTQDRVAQLNAKLQALGNRRININTAIKQMTELMPTDNILASDAVIHKREEEKRKVEALKTELADVERESYELGLKLHRAYKRLDRDAEYEPTTLWVRRVTGA